MVDGGPCGTVRRERAGPRVRRLGSFLVKALVQRVAGLEVQHGHVAQPVGDEVYEREVSELLARDLEHAHAAGRDQPFPGAVVVLQRDRGRRHAQYVLALLVAHLFAHLHAPFRELDPLDFSTARHQASLAHDSGDAAVEAFACAVPANTKRQFDERR